MSKNLSTATPVARHPVIRTVIGNRRRGLSISPAPTATLSSTLPPFSLAAIPRPLKTKVPDNPVHVVLKFGGTSVAKCLSTIVDTITPAIRSSNRCIPILVCSAQSYTIKTEGTTQCLLAAIDAALDQSASSEPEHTHDLVRSFKVAPPLTPPPTPPRPGSPTITAVDAEPRLPEEQTDNRNPPFGPRRIIADILERHLIGSRTLLNPSGAKSKIFDALEQDLRSDCKRVIKILDAVSTFGEISPNVRDTVISFGELMACRTVVAALHSRNIPARLVNLTNLDHGAERSSTNAHSNAPLDEKFFGDLISRIGNRIRSVSKPSPGQLSPVLVATGFFGPIPGSLLQRIGRGYTDVCAALCARAVGAEELQIWKEVDGVFSADPRKILNAQLLPEISSKQAKLLTSYGSEVVHHLAINQANYLNIPIIVKNVINPTAPGTRIVTGSPSSSPQRQSPVPSKTTASPPFAVTLLNDLEMVKVQFPDSFGGHPTQRVMDILNQSLVGDAAGIGLDLVQSSQENVCFMVKGPKSRDAACEAGLGRALDALGRVAVVTTTPGLSYLQAVLGSDPRCNPAIAWKMFGALADADIAIKSISHGPVEYGIGCVVPEKEAPRAALVVHDALGKLLW